MKALFSLVLGLALSTSVFAAQVGDSDIVKTPDGKIALCQVESDTWRPGYKPTIFSVQVDADDNVVVSLGIASMICVKGQNGGFEWSTRGMFEPLTYTNADGQVVTANYQRLQFLLVDRDLRTLGSVPNTNDQLQMLYFNVPVTSFLDAQDSRRLDKGRKVAVRWETFQRGTFTNTINGRTDYPNAFDGGSYWVNFSLQKDAKTNRIRVSDFRLN